MNFRKDVQSLTEAYKHIVEAPTDPGPSFDDTADTPDVKYIGGDVTGGGGDISPEDKIDVIDKIVSGVKDMLEAYEEGHFPGSFKDFRDKIAEVVRAVYPPIGKANSKYVARVIQNDLREQGVIVDEKSKGVKVNTVSSAVNEPIAKALSEPVKSETIPGFRLAALYEINRDLPMTVSKDAKQAHQSLLKQGMLWGKHDGKAIVKASGLSYEKAKVVLPELERVEAIIKYEPEDRSGSEDVEALDYGDENPQHLAYDLTKGGTDTIGTAY
jgi:hypothetical protein|tara:strand:- start:185 stop:994 length:810 start_codon:yes stop_codon:yes gene_type:complete